MAGPKRWAGVRMRRVAARPDPDGAAAVVALPASWDDVAGAAIAGFGAASVAEAEAVWLEPVAKRDAALAARLHALLAERRGAPGEAIWRGEGAAQFVLSPAAFHDAHGGFDPGAFAAAVRDACGACRLLAPDAEVSLAITGLDDWLACLGLDYADAAARDAAAALAALLRFAAVGAVSDGQADFWAPPAPFAAVPNAEVPGLAEAARAAARALPQGTQGRVRIGARPPSPIDALLGVETAGVAPAFAPVRDGRLTRAAQARLAARALSPEAALAAALLGEPVLPDADFGAVEAMHAALAPFMDSLPDLEALPRPSRPAAAAVREDLPERRRSLVQRASVGGRPVLLRTQEYEGGRLGEVEIAAPRESAAVRGLLAALGGAVSVGLQHGVPLAAYLDLFSGTRFGPGGIVDGDPHVRRAASLPDYVIRTLAATYLGMSLPEPEVAETPAPLPLDLPEPGRPTLRLVG